jgi:trimeric autotransporter adhesin
VTDTISRDVRGAAAGRVAFVGLLLAAAAFAQPSLSPVAISMGAIAGSTAPVSVTVSAFSAQVASANRHFRVEFQYAGTAGWLSAGPSDLTAPCNFILTADPSNLAPGNYSAVLIANFGPLDGAATAVVRLTVAPAGSNPRGLTASPSSVVFVPDAMEPQIVTVSNALGVPGVIAFTSFATSTGWLSVAQGDKVTPGTLQVKVDATGLPPGVHTATVLVTTAAGVSTAIPVSLLVPVVAIGPAVNLTPAQKALVFQFQTGTTSNPAQTVFVSTASTQYTSITVTASDPWIGVSAASWLAPSQSTTAFAPGLFYVSVNPTGLASGVYRGSVALSGGGSAVTIPVTLTVSSTPVLNANPSFIGLDAAANLLSSNVAVVASDSFFISATVSANTQWLSVSPTTAVASNNLVNLTVTANAANLPGGTYQGSVTIAGPNGNPSLVVPVQLFVSGAPVLNSIGVAPGTLNFSGMAGDPIAPQYLQIGSAFGPETVSLAATSDGGWLSVEPATGSTPLLASVKIDPATPDGSFTGRITITSLTSGNHVSATVNVNLTARAIAASPAVLTFAQQFNGPPPAAQEVQVTANARSSFVVASQPAWIKVQPGGTFTTPAKLVITADPAGMDPGAYEGAIHLKGPNTVIVQVALTIASPPAPVVSPAQVAFSYEFGSPPPLAQTITVTAPAGPTTFTAAAATESGVDWLAASPTSAATPGAISVSINTARLTPGQHSGSVTVRFATSPPAAVNVPVSVKVIGSTVQIREILNAATGAPGSVAPGEIVTLTGLGLGPSAPVTARPSSAGAFATELGGVRVMFDASPAPLLFVSDSQINAIVPYAIAGRTSTRLQVQVDASYSIPLDLQTVAASPGIFTSSGSGRGQAAALNADSAVNSVLNPASRGSIIVLYMSGEGQTDPPGQDGRVIYSDLRTPLLPVTASIGGLPAAVVYAGSSPSLVSGICQVNVRIPEAADPGAQPVEIRVGGIPSQKAVTIQLQ